MDKILMTGVPTTEYSYVSVSGAVPHAAAGDLGR